MRKSPYLLMQLQSKPKTSLKASRLGAKKLVVVPSGTFRPWPKSTTRPSEAMLTPASRSVGFSRSLLRSYWSVLNSNLRPVPPNWIVQLSSISYVKSAFRPL
ncbi:hypothetical protein D3C86_1891620 [compost metagenome]